MSFVKRYLARIIPVSSALSIATLLRSESVTDGYSKLAEDVEFRAQVAETAGSGFALPTSVRL